MYFYLISIIKVQTVSIKPSHVYLPPRLTQCLLRTPEKLKIIKIPDKMRPDNLRALKTIIMGSNVMFSSQICNQTEGNELIRMKVGAVISTLSD